MTKNKEMLGSLGMFTTALIWGYSFVAVKIIVNYIPTFYLVAFRMLTAAIIMSLVFFKKMKITDKKDIIISIPVGLALFAGFALQTYSATIIPASKTAFYTGAYVVFIPFLVWIIYKKRPHLSAFIAVFIAAIGLALLTLQNFNGVEIGDFFAILGAVMFAIHLILIDNAVSKMSSVRLTIIQMYVAGIVSLTFGVFTSELPAISSLSTETIFSFLYLAIGATALAYLLQNVCQKFVAPGKASLILSLESFLGAMCGIIFLHEPLTINFAIGGFCILGAIGICEIGNNFQNMKNETDGK